MRQDKDREVTILDHKDYIEKCLNILDRKQFHKLSKDPIRPWKGKYNVLYEKLNAILKKKNTRNCTQQDQNWGYFVVQQKRIT